MAEERRSAPAQGGEGQVKVTDRRRFTPEGEPVERSDVAAPEPETAPDPEPRAAGAPGATAEDPRVAEQAARIDELTRAYAALVEDNKAFRQRLEREKARVLEAERTALVQALLESADDLERALAAVSAGEVEGALAEGVRLSLGSLHQRIARLGAERIPVMGQAFDPHLAEAIDTVPVADEEQDGTVLHEIRPGYRIGERILRPARVRVGRLARA
jgi:molecular chaperone GrpE